MRTPAPVDLELLKAVDEGLTDSPKHLPSWLFYDKVGDRIFQQIMQLPEYYLTACELEIIREHIELIKDYFTYDRSNFDIIELGAGDGVKSQLILEALIGEKLNFTYRPVDVSSNVLGHLKNRINQKLPAIKIRPFCGRYEAAFESMKVNRDRKVVLFLGSNIGNYTIGDAKILMHAMALAMNADDFLLVGFDLKKDPRVIQRAYDDSGEVTARFNLNLLLRLNNELNAHFDLDNFYHYPVYDPVSGTAKSYLVSKRKQSVYVDFLDKSFTFDECEPIHTEVSQKYDLSMIDELTKLAGLEIIDTLFDRKNYFCDVVLRKRSVN
jgi:L-histidine Nalpha-methyltransferase